MKSLGPGQKVSGSLAAGRLGVAAVLGCVMSAAAPLTIVAGLVTTGFAVTGNLGLPVAFLAVGVVLAVFASGYVAMSRHLPHSGAVYAFVSHGLGRSAGVATAWLSLCAYNALQTALYGVVGAAAAPLLDRTVGLGLPWWVAALAAWALVGTLGVLRVELNGRVLGVLLVAEVAVICLYDVAWLARPAAGVDWSLLSPIRLTDPGVGAVLALAVLAFTGFETGTSLAEEVKDPRRTVPAATYLAVVVIGLLYAVSSWAMVAATGTAGIVQAAREQGPGLAFVLASARLGETAATTGQVLFATSILAAMLSFHVTTSRYVFALAREQVLPGWFAATSRQGAPKAASLAQSALGLTVIVVWAVGGWDPVATLFYLAGTSGALGVLVLLLVVAVAVVGFFGPDRRGESVWHTRVAPLVAVVALGVVLVLVLVNFAALLGAAQSSPLRWGIPAAYLVVAVAGYGYGMALAVWRPQAYAAIGRGARAVLPPPGPAARFGRLTPNAALLLPAEAGGVETGGEAR